MESSPKDTLPKTSRRSSSILKQSKAPRQPLKDLDPNGLQNDENCNFNKSGRLSRRVSFADTYQVQEYSKDRSFWQSTTSNHEGATNTVKSPISTDQKYKAESKYEFSTTHALLTGDIKYIPMASESFTTDTDGDVSKTNAASPEIASNTAFWNIDHERDADYVFNNMQLGPSRSFEHSIDSSQSSDEMEMTACSGFIRTSPFKAEVMPENDVIEFDRVPCFNYTQNVGKQLPDIPKTVLFEGGDDMEFTHVDNFTIQVGNEYHSKYCDSQSLESQNCSTSDDQHSSTNPAKSLNNSKNAYDDGVCVENTSTIKGSPHVADGNQACIQPDICNEQLIDEMEMKEGENCEISASYNTRKRKNCEDDDNSMITDSALYYKSKICPTDSEDICGIQRQPRIHLLTSTSQLENFVDVKHSNDFGNAQMTKRLHNQTDNNDEGYLEHELRSNTSSSRFNVSVVSALSQDVPTSNRNISKCSSMNSVEKPRDDSIAQIGAGAKKQSSMNVVNETRNNDPIAEPCRDINDSIHESNVNNTLFDSDSQDQLSTVEKVIDSNDRLGDVPAKSQDLLFKEEYLTKYQSSKLTSAICEKSKHMGDESWKSPLALTVQLSTECVDHGSASNLPEEALIIGEKFISKNTESLSLQTPTKEEFSPIKQMTENNDVDVSIADSMTSVKQDPIVDNEGAKPSSWAIDKTKWNLQSKDFEASFQRSDHATASSKEIHQAAANEHYLTITTHLTNSINHDWPKEGDERSAVPSHPENSHQDEALERIDDVPMPHCVEMWCSSKDNDSNFVEKPSILMKVSHDVKVSNVNENIEVDANEAASLLRVQSSEVVHRRSIRRETVVLSKVVHHSVTELSVKEDSEVLAHKSIEPKNNSRQEIETRKPKGGRLCRRLTYLISSKPPVSLDDLSINLGQTDVEPIIHNKSLDKKLIDIAKQNVAQETRDSIVPISSFTSPKEDYAELSVRSSSSAQKLYHKETSLSSKTERHKRPNKQPQEEANFATSRTPWPSLQLRLNKLSKEILDASFAPPRQNGKDHCSKEPSTSTTTYNVTNQRITGLEIHDAENSTITASTSNIVSSTPVCSKDMKNIKDVSTTNTDLKNEECVKSVIDYTELQQRFQNTEKHVDDAAERLKNMKSKIAQMTNHLNEMLPWPTRDSEAVQGASSKLSQEFSGYHVKEWTDRTIHLSFWQDVLHMKFTLSENAITALDSSESKFVDVKHWSRCRDVQCPIARLCHELMLESFEEKEITKKCQTKLELEAMLPNLSLLSKRTRWLYLDVKYASYCNFLAVNGHEITIEFACLQLHANFALNFVLCPGCYPDVVRPEVFFKSMIGTVRSDDILSLLKNIDSNRFYFKNVVHAVEKWLEEKARLLELVQFQ